MRAAPPVSVRCTGGAVWRGAQSALHALAAAVCVFWLLQWLHRTGVVVAGDSVIMIVTAGSGLAGAAAAWLFSFQPAALLRWDGQRWTLGDTPVMPAVMVDLGGWLLLHLHSTGPAAARPGGRWLAISRADAGAALHGLRTALFALTAPVAATRHV